MATAAVTPTKDPVAVSATKLLINGRWGEYGLQQYTEIKTVTVKL